MPAQLLPTTVVGRRVLPYRDLDSVAPLPGEEGSYRHPPDASSDKPAPGARLPSRTNGVNIRGRVAVLS